MRDLVFVVTTVGVFVLAGQLVAACERIAGGDRGGDQRSMPEPDRRVSDVR